MSAERAAIAPKMQPRSIPPTSPSGIPNDARQARVKEDEVGGLERTNKEETLPIQGAAGWQSTWRPSPPATGRSGSDRAGIAGIVCPSWTCM